MKKIYLILLGIVCGTMTANAELTAVEGVYQIGSGQDLIDFAALVNSGTANANAVLTADIDMAGVDISNFPIGTPATGDGRYSGTFNGQGHKISNFKLINPQAATNFGMFNTGSGVVLKNFWLDATCEIEGKELVGLIGRHDGGGTFENVGNAANVTGIKNNIGAFIGGTWGAGKGTTTPTTFRNCWTTGKVLTTDPDASNGKDCGAITGWFNNGLFVFENCWSTAEVVNPKAANNYMFRNGGGAAFTYANNYAMYGEQANFTKIDDDILASGELCYKLNGDQTTITWYQKIGADDFPMPYPKEGATVYMPVDKKCDGTPKEGAQVTYSNNEGGQTDPHNFVDGLCTVCNLTDPDFMAPNADGIYEIGSEAQLKWFAAKVQDGGADIKGQLTADITLSAPWTLPIGTASVAFTGQFDGKGKAIKGFDMTATSDRNGLFGNIKDATVANFSIDGTLTCPGGGSGLGTIGWSEGSNISNIYSTLIISVTGAGVHHVAGIVGSFRAGSTATECYFAGKLTDTGGNYDCFGGIAGYTNEKCLIDNCANYANISFTAANCYVGGICGYLNNANFAGLRNCLNIGQIQIADGEATYAGAIFGRLRSTAGESQNNYWLIGSAAAAYGEKEISATVVDDEMLASGEIAYKLNDGQTTAIWRQSIGYDNYPVLDKARGIVNKIGASGYATQHIADNNVLIPNGITAFTGLIDTPWIALRPLTNIIPAGAAVVLQCKEGYYSFIPVTVDATIEGNDLKGTAEPLEATGSQYVLAEKEGVVRFYQASVTIPAGKAYIEYAGDPVKGFFFGGVETCIENG
ncbi:MAG: hypothetical protein K5945_05735 [Bacteroidaceae bacterium]|nr:hypothetical protein [Bacteroidaceae bacterium]